MAFINLVSWPNAEKDVYAWRYPETNLTTFTQLLVHESQEAVLFSKGQIIGKFGPGKHTLSTENLPLLHKLYGLPFGKKNPFTAEVWFVNKRLPLNLDWRVSNFTVQFADIDYVPIVCSGNYGLKISSAEMFLTKLVGNLHSFNRAEITGNFNGAFEQTTKSVIINYIRQNNLPLTDLQAHLSEFAGAVKHSINELFGEYGLEVIAFFINSIEIDTSDATGKKIKDALTDRTAQNLAGYTWQQKEAMNLANNAVNSTAGGGLGGILGMAMITGGLGGNRGMGNQMMQQPAGYRTEPTGAPGPAKAPRTIFCSNCGKSYPSTSRFCPHCGNKYNPCPVCGADNFESAKRCVSCGSYLPQMNANAGLQQNGNMCPNCGAQLTPGSKFCPNCGSKI